VVVQLGGVFLSVGII